MPSNDKKPDVAKPGKSAPSATARPIIVGHKMLQNDPMVNGETNQDQPKPAEEKPAEPGRTGKIIEPPKAEIAADEKLSDIKADDTTTAKVEATPEEKSAAEDAAIVDAVAEQASSSRKKDGELSEDEKKHQEEIQKLIEDKTYFVPIKLASHKRNARWGWAVFILLLLAAGGYLAVDAGLVSTNIELPIDLIKN